MTPSTLLMCRKRTTNPQTKADVNAIPVSLQASENNLDDGQTNPARNDQFTNPYTKLRLQLPGVHGAASGNDSEGSYYDEIAEYRRSRLIRMIRYVITTRNKHPILQLMEMMEMLQMNI